MYGVNKIRRWTRLTPALWSAYYKSAAGQGSPGPPVRADGAAYLFKELAACLHLKYLPLSSAIVHQHVMYWGRWRGGKVHLKGLWPSHHSSACCVSGPRPPNAWVIYILSRGRGRAWRLATEIYIRHQRATPLATYLLRFLRVAMFGLPRIQRHVPGLPDFEWFLLCFVICILAVSILCHFRHSSALWSYRTHISVTPLLVSVPLVFLLVLVFLLPPDSARPSSLCLCILTLCSLC